MNQITSDKRLDIHSSTEIHELSPVIDNTGNHQNVQSNINGNEEIVIEEEKTNENSISSPTSKDHFAISLNYVMISNFQMQFSIFLICLNILNNIPILFSFLYFCMLDLVRLRDLNKDFTLNSEGNELSESKTVLFIKLLDYISSLLVKV